MTKTAIIFRALVAAAVFAAGNVSAAGAGIEEFCVIVCPGDETAYAEACGALRSRVRFIAQPTARGYGHAILCAEGEAHFTGIDTPEQYAAFVARMKTGTR